MTRHALGADQHELPAGHGYGVNALHCGRPIAWFPANWAHACDDNGEPIPRAKPQKIRIEQSADGAEGVVDAWPNRAVRVVGISETRDSDVMIRFPLASAAEYGDTLKIGPLVRQ